MGTGRTEEDRIADDADCGKEDGAGSTPAPAVGDEGSSKRRCTWVSTFAISRNVRAGRRTDECDGIGRY